MRLTIIGGFTSRKRLFEVGSMSASQIALLGAFAGFTIFFIGLPIGRLRTPMPTLKAGLNAVAIGILIFLLWDVLAHAWEPVDRALAAGRVADVLVMGALLAATFGIGLLGGLAWVDGLRSRSTTASSSFQASPTDTVSTVTVTHTRRLALMIASGIGLHNFAEGLAIGNSAASGELSLAVLLVVGFALHNATEGFGIVAPPGGTAAVVGGLVDGVGPHRRWADFHRDPRRAALCQRNSVGRVSRPGGWLHPVRRHRTSRRSPERQSQIADGLGASSSE